MLVLLFFYVLHIYYRTSVSKSNKNSTGQVLKSYTYKYMLYWCIYIRECSFEKCWGGAENWGGGDPNSILDLGGPCEFRMRGKEPATLHFQIFINLNKRC